jgi:multidrug efflux system membrane fusion protein
VDFPSITATTFDGRVSEVSPALDATTATYPVTVVLDVPNETVKSGMSANVTFDFEQLTETKQKKIIAPTAAVGEDANGKFVFKLVKSEQGVVAEKTTVTIGELTPKGFEVRSGLAPGDLIAIAGLQTLLNGQSVRLQ